VKTDKDAILDALRAWLSKCKPWSGSDIGDDDLQNAATSIIAAIAAMGGGRRWGIFFKSIQEFATEGGKTGGRPILFSSAEAAETVWAHLEESSRCRTEVREYVEQAKESEHERLARIGHETFQKALGRATFIPFHKLKPEWKAACIAQAAAIENARKGAGDAPR
jgi:hypothetical protein